MDIYIFLALLVEKTFLLHSVALTPFVNSFLFNMDLWTLYSTPLIYLNICTLISHHLSYCQSVSLVAQSCPTLCDPVNCSTPGLPVHHQLLESTQTHVHWVSDAIQPSHPLSSPSPPAPNPSQHQGLFHEGLFAWGGQSIGVSASASVLPKNTQGWSPLEWTGWISPVQNKKFKVWK